MVEKPPAITPGVRLYSLGQDRIAHIIESSSVVYLNRSAQAVLELCDGSRRVDEICRVLSDRVGLSPRELHDDVASALGCLAVEKLICIKSSIFDDLTSHRDARIRAVYVRFGEYTLRVQTTSSSVESDLCERFRRLLAPPNEHPQLNLDIIPISGSADEYAFIYTGAHESNFSELFLKGNLDFLKQAIVTPFKWLTTDCGWFHAGAVAKGLHSIILTGLPGSGKSCIATELCRRGWDYLTDEILPISSAQLCTLPYPVTPLPRRYTSEVLPTHRLWELDRDYVELPPDRICDRLTTPATLFLPRFAPKIQPSVQPLEPGVAAAALLNNCISVRLRGAQAIELVTRLVTRVRSYSLLYQDVASACDHIERILADGDGRGSSFEPSVS